MSADSEAFELWINKHLPRRSLQEPWQAPSSKAQWSKRSTDFRTFRISDRKILPTMLYRQRNASHLDQHGALCFHHTVRKSVRNDDSWSTCAPSCSTMTSRILPQSGGQRRPHRHSHLSSCQTDADIPMEYVHGDFELTEVSELMLIPTLEPRSAKSSAAWADDDRSTPKPSILRHSRPIMHGTHGDSMVVESTIIHSNIVWNHLQLILGQKAVLAHSFNG